jgi:3'-phosphoadenosine 5'-phosphosulfate sulfotransferase (PAPS reductase)/FAD synthetase
MGLHYSKLLSDTPKRTYRLKPTLPRDDHCASFFNSIDILNFKNYSVQGLQNYMSNNRLPRHPLVAPGYPSICCAPCTSLVAANEDPRSGHWRHLTKVECGIHFKN